MSRLDDLQRFYGLLDSLGARLGGPRVLSESYIHRDWPQRGVYFFFEASERRSDTGEGLRVVRVGTHAVSAGSRSTLRQRLGQHRGQRSGKGNHRGSIFRLLVGQAILERNALVRCPSWGTKDRTTAAAAWGIDPMALATAEASVEAQVSTSIGSMPFLWLEVDDEPGPGSLRATIERNAIALLSNYERPSLDPPSQDWLGFASASLLVRKSGLWNQRHVKDVYEPAFLDLVAKAVDRTERGFC